jgi:hypothetical protein
MGFGNTNESSGRKSRWGAAALATFMLFSATAAVAADRRVIAECFTSPTCSHCPYAGRALHRLMNELPDTFVSVQYHTSGSANFPWVNTRWNYYYQTDDGTPLVWFDGMVKRLGSYDNDSQMYTWYTEAYNTRMAVATDISIALTGVQTGTNTYEIGITVAQDGDIGPRNLILHVLQVLDNYPSSTDHRYRNCARQHQELQISTVPGESDTYTMSFTLAATDVANITNVKIVAFAQRIGTNPKAIMNAAVMPYPFVSPAVVGDVDGDRDVDLSDLAALLSSYGLCEGDPGYLEAADFVDNDCVDLADLAALLANYGYGG